MAGAWAAFGALLTGLLLRRLDISRMGYAEAKQLLSAMVNSLSPRIQKTETLARELSEQVQILKAKEARASSEELAADKVRLLEYMREWVANVKRVVDKLQQLEDNLRGLDGQFQQLRARMDRLPDHEAPAANQLVSVGVVTENVLAKLSETEKQVLRLLIEGPKSAPQIGRLTGKSREHTARIMKTLFEQRFVERETHHQPYEYRLNDKVREALVQKVAEPLTQSEQQT